MRGTGQQGVALLTALLAVSLLSVVVLEFTHSTQIDRRLAHNTLSAAQARYLARSGINAAEALLLDDDDRQHDNLRDDWAQPFPSLPAGGGWVNVTITDEARKVSLNAMRHGKPAKKATWQAVTKRLFENLALDPALVDGIIDWIDTDDTPVSRDGAEREHYFGLVPPTVPPNGPLMTVSEIAAIRGFDAAIVERLRPFVTVAVGEGINLNTAPPEVLGALDDLLQNDPGRVDEILARRPFGSCAEAAQQMQAIWNKTSIDKLCVVSSAHFQVEATAVVRDVPWRITALLKRQGKNMERLSWEVTRPLTSPEASGVLSESAS